MPLSKPEEEAIEEEGPESDEPLGTRAELEARGDAAGLRELAKAHRGGTRGAAKDMKACFQCYEAAAKLGDAESHYALALFMFAGTVVPADTKAGATHLRAAADGGSIDARVYLANLYELGIHYKADKEKADVWYRSVARAKSLDDESPDYAGQMAELGCVRWALPLIDDKSTPEERRDTLLRKIKARGYSLKLREERDSMVPSKTPPPVAVNVDGSPPSTSAAQVSPQAEEKPAPKKPVAKAKPSSLTLGTGSMAFVYALVFAAAALGAGYLAGEGAKVLHASKGTLPLFEHRVDLVFPSITGVLLVLPSLLVYRLRTVASALGAATLAAGVALYLHGSKAGTLLPTRMLQVLAFSVGAYLATLLVFGLMGGAKKPRDKS